MTDENMSDQLTGQSQGEPSSPSLADKIDFLFRTVYPAGRGPYSYAEAAAGIEELTGEQVSHTSLWKLSTGRATNPTKRLIEALAAFFQVSPAYFFDDEASKQIGDQVELLALLRDTGMKGAHLRAFFELSPEARDMVRELIERTARLEQRHRDK
ncbi:XRE family transcriptional regulator [Nonomuraea sp. NEAU-A123]|uniref:XRE family transcriptional regulator n=1 Tax=Nonomuraea sp. NEAU-A123 TaxID=2839649 RepID=UPI001BE44445|nr:XRE family transcriptional regulator [Nonomuraea sp. NEAU-A123]MBT2233051.1 XRE family transcriptional regulator [Nonomuraea sp. NEAU-A123]